MAKKAVNYLNLKSFWGKAEAWITTNFKALFENDEELEWKINNLTTRVEQLEGSDFGSDFGGDKS